MTRAERIDALEAIAAAHLRHGHVQEVIVQNFRAKPDTAMRDDDDLPLDDYLATIAVLVLISRNPVWIRANMPASLGKPFFPGS